MPVSEVYGRTTESNPESKMFMVPSRLLCTRRFAVKLAEVLLSFLAFVLEEVLTSCLNCGVLYFFEFISCTAFLFTLLLLILLATNLHSRVGITCWPTLDFIYTAVIGLMFFFASCAFAAVNGGTSLEHAAMSFGFLATLAFLADLVLYWKLKGFPWNPTEPEQSSPPEPRPEAEGLTGQTN
ncbi:hypothetical protein CRUP_007661 [Coryphaenoides rupestris]|nr:hypothetical protein CRUP_007661 [Coryphaenoides rupestris]